MNLLLIGEKKAAGVTGRTALMNHKSEASMPQSESFRILHNRPQVTATWLAAHFRIPLAQLLVELYALVSAGWHLSRMGKEFWIDADTCQHLATYSRVSKYFSASQRDAVLKLLGYVMEEVA